MCEINSAPSTPLFNSAHWFRPYLVSTNVDINFLMNLSKMCVEKIKSLCASLPSITKWKHFLTSRYQMKTLENNLTCFCTSRHEIKTQIIKHAASMEFLLGWNRQLCPYQIEKYTKQHESCFPQKNPPQEFKLLVLTYGD